jgi:hypothetical protein
VIGSAVLSQDMQPPLRAMFRLAELNLIFVQTIARVGDTVNHAGGESTGYTCDQLNQIADDRRISMSARRPPPVPPPRVQRQRWSASSPG